MKTSLIKTALLVVLLSGIVSLSIARTLSKSCSDPIEVKGRTHQDEKRSATLPITASISNNQLMIDFLSPLGEVAVSIGSESANVQTVYYTVSSAQSVFFQLEGKTAGEQYSIDFTTSGGQSYYGEFVMK